MTRAWGLDRWGAVASGLCAVHCVAVAVLAGVAPFLSFLGDRRWDYGFLATAAVLGGYAAWSGFRLHRNWLPPALFVLGMSTVSAAMLGMPHDHCADCEVHGHAHAEAPPVDPHLVSALGGVVLVTFHGLNWRMRHHSGACPHHG